MNCWLIPLALGSALAVSGCGGSAAAPGGVPSAPPRDEQSTNVDALLADLDKSERDLEAQLGPTTPTSTTEAAPGGAGGAEPEPSAPEPPAQPAKPSPATPSAEGEAPAATAPPSPCDVACRALASMQRSARRICELTGDDDARCSGARTRVSRAEARCGRAGCECEA